VELLANLLLSCRLHRWCVLGVLQLGSLAQLRSLLLLHLLHLGLDLVQGLGLDSGLSLRLLHPWVVLGEALLEGRLCGLLLLKGDLLLVLAVWVAALLLLILEVLQVVQGVVLRLQLGVGVLVFWRLGEQTLVQLVDHGLLTVHRTFTFLVVLIRLFTRSLHQPVHGLARKAGGHLLLRLTRRGLLRHLVCLALLLEGIALEQLVICLWLTAWLWHALEESLVAAVRLPVVLLSLLNVMGLLMVGELLLRGLWRVLRELILVRLRG